MSDYSSERDQHLRDNALAWLALRHFLPTNLLRRLSWILVEKVGGDQQLDIEKLFDDYVVDDDSGGLGSWTVRPRDVEAISLANYLQRRIKALLWQSDEDVSLHGIVGPFSALTPLAVENAIKVSTADFGTAPQLLANIEFPPDDSINKIVECFKIIGVRKEPLAVPDAVLNMCLRMEMPLAAVAVKHFGDMCADADDWTSAIELYRETLTQLKQFSHSEWNDYCLLLQQIVEQSIAAATRVTSGPFEAATLLSNNLANSSINVSPLFLLNAAHDEMVAFSLSEENFGLWRDRRAAILLPPLLLKSHDVSSALKYWFTKEYPRAIGYFWQTLRRQIALGSASESRMTKAFYAKCLLDELLKQEERHALPEMFWLAIRLLLESGQTKWAENIIWKETIVQSYVDEAVVERMRTHAYRYPGATLERLNVAVELSKGWLETIPPDRTDVAKSLLIILADAAKSWPASFFGFKNLGGRCLEALGSLARNRPEFRSLACPAVVAAVVAKLREESFWTGKSEALKTAEEYVDVLNRDELGQVLYAVLALLDRLDPMREFRPIVQPAIEILISEQARAFSGSDRTLNDRILTTVMRFGIQQKTEHPRLLYYLHDFDLTTFTDPVTLEGLKGVVSDVRENAGRINASNATQNINALLLAPQLAGQVGIDTAIEALTRILRSASEGRPSISFAHGYEALRILVERWQQISVEAGINESELRERMKSLLPLIKAAWQRSEREPSVFASFSIPPSTKPNTTIVHNWAFASLAFAESLDDRTSMLAILDDASKTGPLKDGIELARATRQATGDRETPDVDKIRSEGRDAFYRALGSRLVILQAIESARRGSILQALLDQCLKLGPRPIDAAVFVLASQDGSISVSEFDYSNYEKRLAHNRELRIVLSPVLWNLLKQDSLSGGERTSIDAKRRSNMSSPPASPKT